MNEVEALQPEAAVPAQASGGAGLLLRQAREQHGVSLEALAGTLKVPVDKLAALEAEDWGKLPDAVFARALAQAVCRSLHVDASPILALLPKGGAAKLAANPEGLNTPFKERALRSSVAGQADAGSGGLWKWLALGVVAAAGGAAVFHFAPQWQAASTARAPAASGVSVTVQPNSVAVDASPNTPLWPAGTQLPPEVAVQPQQPVVASPGVAVVPVTPTVAAAAPAEPASTSEVAAPVQPEPSAAPVTANAQPLTAEGMPTAAETPAAQGADAGVPTLRMRTTAQTWVQVRDAQQRVVLEKIVPAGGVLETSAARPLFVVVGKADATTVEVDGQALDLAAVARNNVARFEVK